MKTLIALLSMLAVAGAAAAAAAAPEDIGPATETVGKVFVTTDPASDGLNKKVTDHNDAIEAENQAAQARYQRQLAAYEAEKTSQADAYQAELAAHDAKVAADMAAWRATQSNCPNADRDRCDPGR
jgi:Skp family chaperone for outer membrane proteins